MYADLTSALESSRLSVACKTTVMPDDSHVAQNNPGQTMTCRNPAWRTTHRQCFGEGVRTSLWASDSLTSAAQPRTVLPTAVTELFFRMSVLSSGSLRRPACTSMGSICIRQNTSTLTTHAPK